jgi:alpha-maltose-1-phosphate synthase
MSDKSVTILNSEYPPYSVGGAGMLVGELSKFLSKKIEVEVRYIGDRNFNKGKLKVNSYANNIKGKYQDDIDGILDMSGNMADKKAKIVHNFTWYTSYAAFLMKRLHKIPLISTPTSLEPLRPWKEYTLGAKGYKISKYFEKLALLNSDHIVAQSNAMKKDIQKYYHINEDKISLIPPGVNSSIYTKKSSKKVLKRLNINKDYILFVGRISFQKGIDCLLDAFDRVDKNVNLVCCFGRYDDKE